MTLYAADDLGVALLLVGLVLVGICMLAVITAWLVPSPSAAHKATTRRRVRETRAVKQWAHTSSDARHTGAGV